MVSWSRVLRKFWNFIWHDNSVWSWLANIALAFVLVYFIVYPGLGLFLSTTHPVVAVVSGSMEHGSDFDEWWDSNRGAWYEKNGIDKEMFSQYIFKNGFNKGDIMVLTGAEAPEIEVGDVIVFRSNANDPIIHRVVNKTYEDGEYVFQTKGDHNAGISSPLGEDDITENEIVGKAVFRVPWLGWFKIIFVDLLNFIG